MAGLLEVLEVGLSGAQGGFQAMNTIVSDKMKADAVRARDENLAKLKKDQTTWEGVAVRARDENLAKLKKDQTTWEGVAEVKTAEKIREMEKGDYAGKFSTTDAEGNKTVYRINKDGSFEALGTGKDTDMMVKKKAAEAKVIEAAMKMFNEGHDPDAVIAFLHANGIYSLEAYDTGEFTKEGGFWGLFAKKKPVLGIRATTPGAKAGAQGPHKSSYIDRVLKGKGGSKKRTGAKKVTAPKPRVRMPAGKPLLPGIAQEGLPTPGGKFQR